MSSEVKRYTRCGMSIVEDKKGGWVEYSDYAALEAENARLAEDVKKWQALAQNVETLERITESAEARRAQLAAIQGGMGAPDITTGRGYPAYSVEAVQRITAAMAAEVADAKSARDAYGQNALDMQAQRDALAAELQALKAQEPVALANRGKVAFWVRWTEAAAGLYGPGIKLYAAPPAAQDVSGLAAFAIDLIDGALQGGNFDGGEIQALGVKHGLLQVERRTESCGEHCACAEFGFPSECYRLVKSVARQAQQQEGE